MFYLPIYRPDLNLKFVYYYAANSNKGQCYIKEMNISKNTLIINDSERLHYAMILLLHVDDAGKTKYKYYEHNRLD
jgi:hypothetical protein